MLTHLAHVNGWEPAVYMTYMTQNFCVLHVSNLSARNFRFFLLMYPGSVTVSVAQIHRPARRRRSRGGRGGSSRGTGAKRAGGVFEEVWLSFPATRAVTKLPKKDESRKRHSQTRNQIYSGEDIRGQCITLYRVAFRTGHVLRGHWESVPRDWGAGVDPRNSAAKGSSRSAKEMVLFDT